jgi:hypothetical protein
LTWNLGAESPGAIGALKQNAAVTFGSGLARQIRTFTWQDLVGPTPKQPSVMQAIGSGSGTDTWARPTYLSTMKSSAALAATAWVDSNGKQQMLLLVQGTTDPIGIWRNGTINADYWTYEGAVPMIQ